MEQQVKQVPYGVANFVTVMTQNLGTPAKTCRKPIAKNDSILRFNRSKSV